MIMIVILVRKIVIMIRMLLLKRFSPSAFAVIDTFMDHDSDRQKVFIIIMTIMTIIITTIVMDHDSHIIGINIFIPVFTLMKVDSPAWKIHELLVVNLVRETLKLDQFTQKVFSTQDFFKQIDF